MNFLARAIDALFPSRPSLGDLAPRSFATAVQTSALAKPTPQRTAKRMYAGAQIDRRTSDWIGSGTSFDAELRTSLRSLRNRSRQLVRDNEYAKNAMRVIKNNVIGKGVRFQATVMKRRGQELASDINTAIESLWLDWCRADACHAGGTLSFVEIQRLCLGAVPESGEVLLRKIRGKYFGKSLVPFALEVIESDQLVDEYNGKSPQGNEVRMGVEVDEWQRPIAYWLWPRHPGDFQYVARKVEPQKLWRVPAEEIIHLYVAERPGATRGVPWMHAGLRRVNNMGGLEEAEIIAARASACIMGFIQTADVADPGDVGGALGADEVVDGERVYDMEPAMIKELGPGETFEGWNPQRPNTGLDPFLRLMLRGLSAAIGISYESLSNDYSQANYSSSRLALLNERDTWKGHQQWFIDHALQPIFDDWLEMAVYAGALQLPDFELNRTRYRAVRWIPRGWDWVDPLKEVMAARAAVRAGFTTQQDVIAAKGDDFEDVFQQRRRELDLMDELELVFDTDPAQVNDKGAAQTLGAAADSPAEAAAAGEGGAAPANDADAPATEKEEA